MSGARNRGERLVLGAYSALVALFLASGFPSGALLLAALAAALGTGWFVRTPVIRDWRARL